MKLIHPKIDRYMSGLIKDYPDVLKRLERRAEIEKFPIIGPQVGNFLQSLALMKQATSVLELGSGFGYSAIWFSRGMPKSAKIVMSDFDRDFQKEAQENLSAGEVEQDVAFHVGDALEVLETVSDSFDIIFNDIDKEYYPQVIEPAYKKLKPGGLLISDNTLWYGRVTKKRGDEATRGIKSYNDLLKQHSGFQSFIVPIRDGVSVSIKR